MISNEVVLASTTAAIVGLFAYLKVVLDRGQARAQEQYEAHLRDVRAECSEWKTLALSLIAGQEKNNAIVSRLTDAVEGAVDALKEAQRARR